MKILPINNKNQISSKAVNQKYYQWAKKDIERGIGFSGEILTQIKMLVNWKDMPPQDGIDTLLEIKKILPNTRTDIDRAIEYVKAHLDLLKK